MAAVICTFAIVVIADNADATDDYSFVYDGYTVTQTGSSVHDGMTWIEYSIDDGVAQKAYAVGYVLNEGNKTATLGDDGENKAVTGQYGKLIIPPIVRYAGNDYTVNAISMNFLATAGADHDEDLISFVLAAGDSTSVTVSGKAFWKYDSLTDATIGGIVSGDISGSALFLVCPALEAINLGSAGTIGQNLCNISTPDTENLTITMKTTSTTDITQALYYQETGKNVILRLSEGSVKAARMNLNNISSVEVHDLGTLWSESVSINSLANTFVGSGEPSITCYHVFGAGDAVVAPATPSKAGHIFAGWVGEIPNSAPAEDVIVVASWECVFTYTFRDISGEVIVEISFTSADMDSKVMPDVPAIAGYTGAWDTEAFSLENKNVNALYTPITYTFTFMNGTETVATVEFNVENMASKTMPEVPAKAGYTGLWDVTEFALVDKTVNAVYVKLAPVSENGTADVTLSDGETSFIPAAGTKTVNVEIAADTFVKVEDATGLANKVVVTKVDAVTNSTGIAGTAYEFTFTVDGTVYNGKIQVTLPYTKEAGKEPAVYFWNGTDSVKMKVISSTETSVTFETDHNSMYVVASETPSKDDGNSFMLYLGIILVVGIVAAMLVGFTFYRRGA